MPRKREMENPTRLEIRIPSLMVADVDRWRGGLPDVPSRGEAVRRLIGRGLGVERMEATNV